MSDQQIAHARAALEEAQVDIKLALAEIAAEHWERAWSACDWASDHAVTARRFCGDLAEDAVPAGRPEA